jgi:ubiquinone/menaquinone biosynthesis C-methylase UbiE
MLAPYWRATLKLKHVDKEREFDWGKTSADYSIYRTGYPDALFDILGALGVGLPGQRILDLGTGTGALARAFARRGAEVTGVDISASQIAEAKKIAERENLEVTFFVGKAEDVEFENPSFDVVTAGQAWIYFDASRVIPKVLKVLANDGRLALTHVQWLPQKDEIAAKTEDLILKYNPDWTGAGYKGDIRPILKSVKDDFDLKTFHVMNEPIEFTRESWRGRIRACWGIGATLSSEEIARFDAEHQNLLERIAPETFTVLHQLAVHIYVRKGNVIDVARFQSNLD